VTRPDARAAPSRAEIPPEAPAVLTVDIGALRRNYRKLKELAAPAACAAVVKADAYGIGARRAVAALAAEGCDTFFVATLEEARLVRETAHEITLYVLDGLLPGTAPLFAALDARPILGSVDEIEDWAAFARGLDVRLCAALHLDTGMNRLGLRGEEFDRLVRSPQALEAFDIGLVISHLACADEPENPKNEVQRLAFDEMRGKLPPAPACLANSGGVFLGAAYHYDMVRPGIALYGGRATASDAAAMAPVVHMAGRILQTKRAEAGETVGYGATRTLERPTRLAIVAAGYADGYFRALGSSNAHAGAMAYLGDYRTPILGRVSMDLIAVDVTDVPADLAQRGAFVELLGTHVGIDDLADVAGTIGYEVLTRLGPRCHRVYVED